jgi:NAD-dependent deacetylase
MESKALEAIELIRQAARISVLSGAGISTEAGIPDFRGPNGLWADSTLLQSLSAAGFRRDPAGFYHAILHLLPNLATARPTMAHRLVAQLEGRGRITGVVTQNIDGLHQKAGSRTVHEIHGTYRTGRCVSCNAPIDMQPMWRELERGGDAPPRCRLCGGAIKPDIVLFEDMLPERVFECAVEAVTRSEVLLVMGSSLMVYPAADLPRLALQNGAALVIVNLEETGHDACASVVVRGRLGEFAQMAFAELGLDDPV